MKQHEIIQYIRKARGLTQRELSEKINVASSVMSRAENSAANKENTEAICRALGINKLEELEFTDEIIYFELTETVNSDIDLAFIYFLAQKKSKVYLLHSDLNLSLKNKKKYFGSTWIGFAIDYKGSLLVFLREERMPLPCALGDFLRQFALNKHPETELFITEIRREIDSLYNHARSADSLRVVLQECKSTRLEMSLIDDEGESRPYQAKKDADGLI